MEPNTFQDFRLLGLMQTGICKICPWSISWSHTFFSVTVHSISLPTLRHTKCKSNPPCSSCQSEQSACSQLGDDLLLYNFSHFLCQQRSSIIMSDSQSFLHTFLFSRKMFWILTIYFLQHHLPPKIWGSEFLCWLLSLTQDRISNSANREVTIFSLQFPHWNSKVRLPRQTQLR